MRLLHKKLTPRYFLRHSLYEVTHDLMNSFIADDLQGQYNWSILLGKYSVCQL